MKSDAATASSIQWRRISAPPEGYHEIKNPSAFLRFCVSALKLKFRLPCEVVIPPQEICNSPANEYINAFLPNPLTFLSLKSFNC